MDLMNYIDFLREQEIFYYVYDDEIKNIFKD